MTELKIGIYASFQDNTWKILKPTQVDAYKKCKYQHYNSMYSMGSTYVKWGNQNVKIDDKLSYNFYIDLEKNQYYMQLGDTFYHEILEVNEPSGIYPASFFKN